MRHKCQVYNRDGEQCEEPAVDYGEITGMDLPASWGEDDDPELYSIRVWMCAFHWDEHQKRGKE